MKQTNLQKAQVRLREKFIKNGVKMLAPETVYFSKDTKIGKNVIIEPYVVLGEKVKIQNNSKIKSFSHLEDVKIENNVTVGPFARLRPGTILKSGSRVGNFVEIKKSNVGKNSKVNHLSFLILFLLDPIPIYQLMTLLLDLLIFLCHQSIWFHIQIFS